MTNDEKLQQIAAVTQEWLDKQGHDKCWYYPEYFRKIVEILGLQPTKDPNLPPEAEFDEFCGRYRQEVYHEGKH